MPSRLNGLCSGSALNTEIDFLQAELGGSELGSNPALETRALGRQGARGLSFRGHTVAGMKKSDMSNVVPHPPSGGAEQRVAAPPGRPRLCTRHRLHSRGPGGDRPIPPAPQLPQPKEEPVAAPEESEPVTEKPREAARPPPADVLGASDDADRHPDHCAASSTPTPSRRRSWRGSWSPLEEEFEKAAADFERIDAKLTAARVKLDQAADDGERTKARESIGRLENGRGLCAEPVRDGDRSAQGGAPADRHAQ